ncbi:MAG TPA: hypothetical protein DCG12_09150 [Planctomycetaceae bacterium]|nr:hypothetical protein [Planctomycetaceae bacterium]
MSASAQSSSDTQEWSETAVRLLQGVIYREDERQWNVLQRNISPLEEYFSIVGLQLAVDDDEGLAWLRQPEADEVSGTPLPRLIRRTQLSYDATLLTVVLRDELHRFEQQDVDNERCVIHTDQLFQLWRPFFPAESDDVSLRRSLLAALRTLESLRFVRRFGDRTGEWEIRRILKARVIAAELEAVRDALKNAASPS